MEINLKEALSIVRNDIDVDSSSDLSLPVEKVSLVFFQMPIKVALTLCLTPVSHLGEDVLSKALLGELSERVSFRGETIEKKKLIVRFLNAFGARYGHLTNNASGFLCLVLCKQLVPISGGDIDGYLEECKSFSPDETALGAAFLKKTEKKSRKRSGSVR